MATDKKINPQLKIMGILSLLFFGGIAVYTLTPEGPLRGMATTVICVLSLYSLFKAV
jgi:hypothetical protein